MKGTSPAPLPQDDPGLPPLGILIADDDGSRLQCHICGQFYPWLGRHVVKAHHITGAAYRESYGLNRKTRLMSPALQAKYRERFTAHLDAIRPAQLPGVGIDPAQRRANASAPRRLQARLTVSQARRSYVRTHPSPPRPEPPTKSPAEPGQRTLPARQALDVLRTDPTWRAQFSTTIRRIRSRLADADVRDILSLNGQASQRAVAQRYGIAPQTVRLIWEGKRRPED